MEETMIEDTLREIEATSFTAVKAPPNSEFILVSRGDHYNKLWRYEIRQSANCKKVLTCDPLSWLIGLNIFTFFIVVYAFMFRTGDGMPESLVGRFLISVFASFLIQAGVSLVAMMLYDGINSDDGRIDRWAENKINPVYASHGYKGNFYTYDLYEKLGDHADAALKRSAEQTHAKFVKMRKQWLDTSYGIMKTMEQQKLRHSLAAKLIDAIAQAKTNRNNSQVNFFETQLNEAHHIYGEVGKRLRSIESKSKTIMSQLEVMESSFDLLDLQMELGGFTEADLSFEIERMTMDLFDEISSLVHGIESVKEVG